MGVTIHYRGGITNLESVEEFENRVLDLAIALGGTARIWRSSDATNPRRMVRGLILNLVPGQESTSLLISPEGWLTGLGEIEAAEQGNLKEPSWCSVKTQFGSLEGHVALIEMFRALKQRFLRKLELSDEGEYWNTGDVGVLATKMGLLDAKSRGGSGLGHHGLSSEAAEDPEIVAARVFRVASLVQQTLGKPAEDLSRGMPVFSDEDGEGKTPEARWDEIERFRRRTQERLQRAIQERLAQGEGIDDAVRGALDEAGLPTPDQIRIISSDDSSNDDEEASDIDAEDDDVDSPEVSPFEGSGQVVFGSGEFPQFRPPTNPLLTRASDLYLRAIHVVQRLPESKADFRMVNARDSLIHGLSELCGGLAQATFNAAIRGGLDEEEEQSPFEAGEYDPAADEGDGFESNDLRAMSIVQFKRALRGAAFALGALRQIDDPREEVQNSLNELHEQLQALNDDLFRELTELRRKTEEAEEDDFDSEDD